MTSLTNGEVIHTNGTVTVYRCSMFSGKPSSITVTATAAQFWKWRNGVMIQDAFPNLTENDREFIMTGVLPAEWDEMFAEKPEDDHGSV